MDIDGDDKFDQLLSKALEKESFRLPHGFADRIVAMAEKQLMQKEARRDRWWLIGGIILMFSAVIFVITWVDLKSLPNIAPKLEFTPGVGVFTFFQGYSGLVIFAILFITILHIIDKRLLKKQESG